MGGGSDAGVLSAATPRRLDNDPRMCCTLWVDHEGYIQDCCEQTRSVLGYPHGELQGLHVSALLPALADLPLVQNGALNPRLAFMCRCASFRAVGRDGVERDCFLFINVVGGVGATALTIMVARRS